MPLSQEIHFAKLEELYLDPMNPRLGRSNRGLELSQERILDLMEDFNLEELAVSFLEGGGFWINEAVLVVRERIYGQDRLIVVEGNRRLAALILLTNSYKGNPLNQKWRAIAKSAEPPPNLFVEIPYILADSRNEIQAFLGFRHVTGIKEWDPDEKAEFISKLIDEQGKSYEQVMRLIGSKTPVVRQSYIAYRLLIQIENSVEGFSRNQSENRFSVMYLSLRTQGVQRFLQIDIQADPERAKTPVPETHIKNLSNFALWLFGTESQPPLFTDSRLTDKFGEVLESPTAVEYLIRNKRPSFDIAYQVAGGDEPEITDLIESASDNIEWSLTRVHHYRESEAIKKAVYRLGTDAMQLLNVFPSIKARVEKDVE